MAGNLVRSILSIFKSSCYASGKLQKSDSRSFFRMDNIKQLENLFTRAERTPTLYEYHSDGDDFEDDCIFSFDVDLPLDLRSVSDLTIGFRPMDSLPTLYEYCSDQSDFEDDDIFCLDFDDDSSPNSELNVDLLAQNMT